MSTADETRAFYAERGIGARVGYGSHPAVLIVDMQIAFNDSTYKVGSDQTPAVEAIRSLVQSARPKNVPIVYVRTGYRADGRDGGLFVVKIPALLEVDRGSRGYEIDPRIAPDDEDYIVDKRRPSAFFQTELPSILMKEGIDTVILTGCSTSGCIRATAVDGLSHGFRVIVPAECVSDRSEAPHEANLLDIDAKYGDVVQLTDVIEYLDALPARVRSPVEVEAPVGDR
jgi:maleamate amidohydrolase